MASDSDQRATPHQSVIRSVFRRIGDAFQSDKSDIDEVIQAWEDAEPWKFGVISPTNKY